MLVCVCKSAGATQKRSNDAAPVQHISHQNFKMLLVALNNIANLSYMSSRMYMVLQFQYVNFNEYGIYMEIMW